MVFQNIMFTDTEGNCLGNSLGRVSPKKRKTLMPSKFYLSERKHDGRSVSARLNM